jgi:hypothetical protein
MSIFVYLCSALIYSTPFVPMLIVFSMRNHFTANLLKQIYILNSRLTLSKNMRIIQSLKITPLQSSQYQEQRNTKPRTNNKLFDLPFFTFLIF